MKNAILALVLFAFSGLLLTGCDIPDPIDEPIYYTVTFLNEDNSLLQETEVLKGTDATAPVSPTKTGYEFKRWDTDFTNVQQDLTIRPTFEEKILTYQVVFLDANGNIMKTEEVVAGESATAPTEPTKLGYLFKGWDVEFDEVLENLEVKPVFEVIIAYYEVVFKDTDGTVLDTQQVREGFGATMPSEPVKLGYLFLGWDRDFNFVWSNMEITATYQLIQDPNTRIQYTSYVDHFNYRNMYPSSILVDQLDYSTSVLLSINNIYSGGFRGADQMHYYDATNYITRNVYGFEVAVDASGIVMEKGTLVNLPVGGFILSGHTSTADFLKDRINLGDIIIYRASLQSATVYRDINISSVIGVGIMIDVAMEKIASKVNTSLIPLNYELILEKMNEIIGLYNELVLEYSYQKESDAKALLLDVDFLMVEAAPVQVKSFWHYPLRSGSYSESNLVQVQALLNKVAEVGFNRVYLNTNFGGWSVYQSKYLTQQLSTFNTYAEYKDYLECFIAEAHKRGIEVYAWTNTLIAGDGYLSNWYDSRGWATISYQGSKSFGGMYFLDISNPEVQEFINNVYGELASNYQLDGLEYDFIRYPNGNLHIFNDVITAPSTINDSGYTDTFINKFKEAHPFEGTFKENIASSKAFRTTWLAFKMQTLTDTVEVLSQTIRSARPDIKISAAVMPNAASARTTYLQDWETWITNGWVDELDPMIYSGSLSYVTTTLTNMIALVNGRAKIIAGIFPENDGGASGMNADQITAVTNLQVDGWAKFSSKTIFGNAALTHSFGMMNRHYAALPTSTDEAMFRAYILDLLDKVEYFYQYADQTSNYNALLAQLELALEMEVPSTTEDYVAALGNIHQEINRITNTTIKNRLLSQHQLIAGMIE